MPSTTFPRRLPKIFTASKKILRADCQLFSPRLRIGGARRTLGTHLPVAKRAARP
jgi:hypothetical protein